MQKTLIRIGIILLPSLVAALATFIFLRSMFLAPANPSKTELSLVEVATGSSFRELCHSLEDKGIVKKWWVLDVWARLNKKDKKINAGEYELSPAMTPSEILGKLASGITFKRKVTFIEGATMWELPEAVENAGLLSGAEITAALTDKKLLNMAGIDAGSFEGYLSPETYFFSRPITADRIIWAMLEEGDKFWSANNDHFNAQLLKFGLTRHEIVTLASIIQKEAGNEEEMPIIASVFHNRLREGMRLQADPTVIYGIANFNGNLTRQDLETPGPYNTYLNSGLPPGPISNPGKKAIEAALFPAETEYLFFVADGTGKHVFASTLREHNENVQRYQLKKSGN